MPTVTVNDASLTYDDDGHGGVVVFLHAGIADREMWRPVAGRVAAGGHRTIRYDLRGYGESSLPPAPFAHHDDLGGLLRALGVRGATLVGCSLGGAVAVDAALAHPDLVDGLVLVGSAVSGHRWSSTFHQLWDQVAGDVDDEDLDALADAEVRFWVVGPGRRAEDLDPDLLRRARDWDRRALAAEAELAKVDERHLDPPAADRLGDIHVPARVLAGADDVPDIRWLADRLAAELPGARRLPDVPDAAHLLPVERPEAVAAAVLDLVTHR